MNLITVEDAIVARLVSQITTVQIQSWPDNPADYQLTHPNGAILVRYDGSEYVEPEANDQKKLIQDRRLNWSITILQLSLKDSKGHQGVYTLIESVRTALTGYTVSGFPDASVMFPTADTFTQEIAGTWIYSINFAFTYPEHET